MAITGAIYNSLIFGGVDSADYGIYITGEGVYNAPNRAVEFVSVPGRNGDIVLDLGHWENISITYPAGTFGDDQSDFAANISAFRNAIVSQIGYQRLTDTYHPDEYRLGVYVSGLDVKPVQMGRAGEFEITFNCKPQRYLTSGETAITVSSGDTVTNPTLYESSPLLAIGGTGTVAFNGFEIEIDPGYYGETNVLGNASHGYVSRDGSEKYDILTNLFNSGDNLTAKVRWIWSMKATNSNLLSITNVTESGPGETTDVIVGVSGARISGYTTMEATFSSASASTQTYTYSFTASFADSTTASTTLRFRIVYSANANTVTFNSPTETGGSASWNGFGNRSATNESLTADSTKSYLGDVTYIDCELGEAYRIDGDTRTSLNAYIALGSDLPKLAPGENAITYDGTVTSLEVTPRWWQL